MSLFHCIFKTTNVTDSGRTFHHNPFYGMDLWEKCKTFRKQGQNTAWPHATMSCINIKESTGCTLTRQDFQNLDLTQTFAEDGHLPLLHWKIRFQERNSFQLSTLSQDWWFITEQSRENTDSQPSRVPRELTKLLLTHNWKWTFVYLLNLTSAPSSAKCLPLNSPPPPSSFLWLMFKRSAVRQCAKQAIVPRISEGLLEVTTN